MNEAFLHHLFDSRKLGSSFNTTESQTLDIIQFGSLNRSSGPDFLEAQIKFDDKVWAGHIEFHLNSSDWLKHQHQSDKAYDNVIAHFVWNHDCDIYINQFKLPVVELKKLVPPDSFKKFEVFNSNKNWIPCSTLLSEDANSLWGLQEETAVVNRFERKSEQILDQLKLLKGDKTKLLIQLLAKQLGGQHNKSGFETLAQKIDFSILQYLEFDPFKIQSFVHGVSGLLTETKSRHPYILKLKKEFKRLKVLLQINSMSTTEWRFYGMHAPAHPTNRIAQFAALLCNLNGLSSNLNVSDIWDITLDDYWDMHYNFNTQVTRKTCGLSDEQKQLLVINVQLPFEYAIAKLKADKKVQNEILQSMLQLNPESNAIIAHWRKIGVQCESAFASQALIEQKNEYCNQKKCLICIIGKTILNR